MDKNQSNNKEEPDPFLSENDQNLIFKKYLPIKKIGNGSFSKVYLCQNIQAKKNYAMKVEKCNLKARYLQSEAYCLVTLKHFGLPECVSYGRSKKCNILIETLLGKSLLGIIQQNNKAIELPDLCLIAIQILDRIEWIHSQNFIHKDLKPENFLFGHSDPDVLYLIDFGLCKKYKSSKTGKHISQKFIGKFNGTVRYASVNSLEGKETSRRDDLISIGFMLIFLNKLKLPWKDNNYINNKKDYLMIIEAKKPSNCEKLCQDLPNEITSYMKYVNSLRFEQDPDYDYLRSLFKDLLNNLNCNLVTFSWLGKKNLRNSFKDLSKKRKSPQCRLYEKIKNNLSRKKQKNEEIKIEKITNENESIKNKNLYKNEYEYDSSSKISKKIKKNNDKDLLFRKIKYRKIKE